MRLQLTGVSFVLLAACLAGCGSLGDDSEASSDSSYSAPASDYSDTPSVEDDSTADPGNDENTEVPDDPETSAADGLPDVPVGAPARCTQAMEALEAAGGDALETDAKSVLKTLTACNNLSEWLGGLYAVPEAFGYSSAGEISNDEATDTVQIVCAGELKKPVCSDAERLGVLGG